MVSANGHFGRSRRVRVRSEQIRLSAPQRLRLTIDGNDLWSAPRHGVPINGCYGVAITSTAVYDRVVQRMGTNFHGAGHEVRPRRAARRPTLRLLGNETQIPPMVGPDGTIYQFTQESSTVCHFVALTDTGTDLVQKWSVPWLYSPRRIRRRTDGSVYHLALTTKFTVSIRRPVRR